MKRDILTRLLAVRDAQQPVALVTALPDGSQALVLGQGAAAENQAGQDFDLVLDPESLAEVKAMLAANRGGRLSGARDSLFVRSFNPELRLLIVGAVHIAQTLAPVARLAGYAVTIVDPRQAWITENRFPDQGISRCADWPDSALEQLALDSRTAVVTLSHDPKIDDPALRVALASPAFYIGSLGSRKTHASRLQRLRDAGVDEVALKRIHSPIGLALGGRAPAEIAVAVMAEIVQTLHGRAS